MCYINLLLLFLCNLFAKASALNCSHLHKFELCGNKVLHITNEKNVLKNAIIE